MDVVLHLSEDSIIGLDLVARDDEGRRIISDLISGKISGLGYDAGTVIYPHAGGQGSYHFSFPK